jgi:S-adenosylmethionine:tRNA ribosyltransferase-isomerase
MRVSDFDFDLPPELIAQQPAAERAASRLLLLDRRTGATAHHTVADLPSLLQPGDLLAVNNTRVFPARLLGRRAPSGGAVECLLVRKVDETTPFDQIWEALAHPGQKLKPGARVVFEGEETIHAEVLERRFFGRRLVRLWTGGGAPLMDVIDRIGHVPLPPYIKRGDERSDHDRYQTLFAQVRGSIAAPTAGLHFNEQLVSSLGLRGVEIAQITLHVGYGTFQPVRVPEVEDHRLEAESYAISDAAAGVFSRALAEGRRVIAVGTTTTRTLESVARVHPGRMAAESGTTDLFIYPGFDFRVVTGLLTNFHLPQSSLLMLVCAFAGREPVLAAYREAIARGYRFYSYGDAMLIL